MKKHLFTNGYDYMVHYSLEDARNHYAKEFFNWVPPFSKGQEEEMDGDGWEQVPDDELFPITDIDEIGVATTQTVAEWCQEYGIGCVIASTEC